MKILTIAQCQSSADESHSETPGGGRGLEWREATASVGGTRRVWRPHPYVVKGEGDVTRTAALDHSRAGPKS